MVPLSALWLPIILSAVFVFIASSIMHMILPYHKSDYRKLPDEDQVLSTLRGAALKRGLYIFPCVPLQDMKSPAAMDKFRQGPVGMMTITPNGPPAMPTLLSRWLGFLLLIGFFVAYLAGHTVPPGAYYLQVFRVVGTAAFLAYGFGTISKAIWKGQTLTFTIKEVIDGLVYALLTAGTFGWLWPR